ncbi:hypothetical protein TNCV_813211 [Trichonephila clavipes]|nr:hypothetical protein TNCV_813211 [Trichonephila clavipes]
MQLPELTTPVQIPVTPELTTPQPPEQIPDPPVHIVLPGPPVSQPPVILPDPFVVETLVLTLMDNSSMDQIMSSVFGDYSQQVIQAPPDHTQEHQVLDTVPSLFDESNYLISFLYHFETKLAREQQEIPMDLTMPRLKKKVRKTTGPVSTSHQYRFGKSRSVAESSHVFRARHYPYTIIFEPNFGVQIPQLFGKTLIVFTSYLDLTWDKVVELRFFQVGRPLSRQVWDAYQPQNTDAYTLNFTDCTRVAAVNGKWLTWLEDREMHRDDNVP